MTNFLSKFFENLIFYKFKKTLFLVYFLPISPTFEANKVFLKKSGSVKHNFISVSSNVPKFWEI